MAETIESAIKKADHATLRAALQAVLVGATTPAFGALPKREMDLLLLEALIAVGYLDSSPDLYSLVRLLRTTKSRARALLYERELRLRDSAQLDEMVRSALRRPLLQKQGEVFCIEVENPLVADHVRALLREVGHASDGSFSPSLIRISLDAAAALIERMIEKSERPALKKALVAAGAPDKSLKGAIHGVLTKVGSKVAGKAGEALMEDAAGYIAPLLGGAKAEIEKRFGELFDYSG